MSCHSSADLYYISNCWLFFFLQTFCYSASNDVVQICLQTYGHFNVEPDIERKARNFYLTSNQPCHYHLTHSNNQIHSQYPRTQGFFSGPGQILMSQCEEAQMTLSPGKKDSDAEHKNISSYQRLGPGFSILGGEMSNVTNASLEKIQALAANIDPFLNFTKDQVRILCNIFFFCRKVFWPQMISHLYSWRILFKVVAWSNKDISMF